MKLFYNLYMEIALKQAELALTKNEVPVGAVIVDNSSKKIIAKSYNQVVSLNSPCAHAEMLAIEEACKNINNYRLLNHSLYSTLEPCPMCAGAILQARIPFLFFGAYDIKYGAIENNARVFYHPYPHKPEIYGGIYEKESKLLLQTFFKEKRLQKVV